MSGTSEDQQFTEIKRAIVAASKQPEQFDVLADLIVDAGDELLVEQENRIAASLDEALARLALSDDHKKAALEKAVGRANTAAIGISIFGKIMAANATALAELGAAGGKDCSEIGISAYDFEQFKMRVGGNSRSLLVATNETDGTPHVFAGGYEQGLDAIMLVKLSSRWLPELDRALMEIFGLSKRECAVLQELYAGDSANLIAKRSGRAVGTVRQQIKSILAKLQLRNQNQVLSFVAAAHAAMQKPSVTVANADAPQLNLATATRGRREVNLRWFGQEDGVPILFFHGTLFGFGEFPKERQAAQIMGLKVIGIERPGYGRAMVEEGETNLDTAVEDSLTCLDHFGVEKAVVVTQDFGIAPAFKLLERAPERVAGIVGVSALPPVRSWDQTEGMPPQQRVFALAQLKSPRFAEFLVDLGLSRMRRLGHEAWSHAVFAGVGVDEAVSAEIDNLAPIARAYAFNTTQKASGFKRDLEDVYRDWMIPIEAVTRPVLFMHGRENKTVTPRLIEPFASKIPDAAFEWFDAAGHTLCVSHSQVVLSRALAMAARAGMA